LHHVLAIVSLDIAASFPIFECVVSEQSYGGNGFAVLNELLRLHFPHVHGTRAPSFDSVTAKKILRGPSETIPEYEERFTLWLQSLHLYREFGRYQDSEVTMWFIDGYLSRHQLFLNQEYVNLKQFHSLHRLAEEEPSLPDHIQHYFLYERLRLAQGTDATARPKSTPLGAQVAMLDTMDTYDYDPPPTFDSIEEANIAALHHHHQQGRGPPNGAGFGRGFVIEKPARCNFAPCQGWSHPPNICCICDAPTHRVTRCWHLLGLPMDHAARVTAFKQTKQAGNAPFAKAQVAFIDEDDVSPPPTAPPADQDMEEIAAGMRILEEQFHPGYAFPSHSSAINGLDIHFCPDISALDVSDTLPDLIWPDDPAYDSDDTLDPLFESSTFARCPAVPSRTVLNPSRFTAQGVIIAIEIQASIRSSSQPDTPSSFLWMSPVYLRMLHLQMPTS
jgi:hypothetical protein